MFMNKKESTTYKIIDGTFVLSLEDNMNNIINILITYKAEIICALAWIFIFIVTIKDFSALPKSEQIKQIQGWLLGAVTLAEAEYGSGTGKIKLSAVYDKFVEKFPWIAKVLSFEKFSEYVDEALVEMRKLLATNKAIASMVAPESSITKTSPNKEI